MPDSPQNGTQPNQPKPTEKAENTQVSPAIPGGLGGTATIGGQPVIDPRTGNKDLRLLRAATRWNIPEHTRKLIHDEMVLSLVGKNRDGSPRQLSERERVNAAKVLVAADSVDARREATDAMIERAGMSVQINTGGGGAVVAPVLVIELEKDDRPSPNGSHGESEK